MLFLSKLISGSLLVIYDSLKQGVKKFKSVASIFLSGVLFLGGVTLLVQNPQFWGVLFGVPATILGIIFIIISFDSLNQLTLEDET